MLRSQERLGRLWRLESCRGVSLYPSGPGLAGAADGLNPGAALCASGFTPLVGEQGSQHPRRKLVAFGDLDCGLHTGLGG